MQYATFCPEDNKLRLYVGRVPRDEYEKLRADGWICTPKQDCNFVATWTPSRRDTALAYSGGVIEDEDQSPEDRAADRAERFGDYRDKRTSEAVGHADSYDSGPQVHGFQSQARAERSAARHDRQAGYACDAWSKAEYWTARTAGVISHALYKSSPGVRMGRIKTLEADLRRLGESQGEWAQHYRLRLAYENQMLEAQGGRAAHVEMQVGGFIGKWQIHRINKSPATGRVVSVHVRVERVTGWAYKIRNVPGTDYALSQIETERLPVNAYRPPTPEDLATLAALLKATKAAKPKSKPCPLINPTDDDAERLQKLWNAATIHDKPGAVIRMTQAEYSERSGGNYSSYETVVITEHGLIEWRGSRMCKKSRCQIFKIRKGPGSSVVILTDKPQKPLPFKEMEAARAKQPTTETMRPKLGGIQEALCRGWLGDEVKDLLSDAQYVGWVDIQSMSQIYWTKAGAAEYEKHTAEAVNA